MNRRRVLRTAEPRLAPLPATEWDDDARPIIETSAAANGGKVFNVLSTMARYPKLLKRWNVFGGHVLTRSTLPPRVRELVILRTGFVAHSGYEWAQHVDMARAAGCTDDEIARVAEGPDAGWNNADRAVLRATDELVGDYFVSDATWDALRAHLSEHQILDLVFAVGQYTLVSMALNTLGVQIEDGVDLFPASLFDEGHFRHGRNAEPNEEPS
jgi:alkylhydroperoxidase family enzyme